MNEQNQNREVVELPAEGDIDVEELDDYLDNGVTTEQIAGRYVVWHNDERLKVTILDDGSVGLEITLECGRCLRDRKENPPTFTGYLTSGLHSGAWPYLRDKAGTYLANLRDQEFVCEECSEKQPEKWGLFVHELGPKITPPEEEAR